MALTKDKLISATKLEELEAAHVRIAHVKCKEDSKGETPWEVVLRKPKRTEVKMFRAQSHNPAQVAEAQEILMRKLVVYPELSVVDAWLEDGWAIGEACGSALNNLMGLGAQAEDVK